MPLYEYRCAECGSEYEVFHKVREVAADVACPSCGSADHERLMSLTGLAINSVASSFSSTSSAGDSCGSGSCCGGSCGVN